jgi:hypothetical protein
VWLWAVMLPDEIRMPVSYRAGTGVSHPLTDVCGEITSWWYLSVTDPPVWNSNYCTDFPPYVMSFIYLKNQRLLKMMSTGGLDSIWASAQWSKIICMPFDGVHSQLKAR